ncbi:hypothetical protein [uncultured Jatrophihabitans sp.]|uniref:hypothetical protein n=1 Tax=uncultured Jatrophihabitans sp. TaxID=1610747 RepID=UPI0035CA38AE
MLTRPSVPAVLDLLSHAVAQPDAGQGHDLALASQLLALTARRVRLEPEFVALEIQAYAEVGELVLAEGLDQDGVVAAVLHDLRDHLARHSSHHFDSRGYALGSEVLCQAIDATHGTTGDAANATAAALALREDHQTQVVGDFTVAGR